MNNTKLDELLEDIFTNRRDVWDLTYRLLVQKKENFIADKILKLTIDKIKRDLPRGVVVCFPGSIFHNVGIEPGISRRRQPSI